MTRTRVGARVLGLGAVFLVLVSTALPLWTLGGFGYSDAPAVRHGVLWDQVWSGWGGGDSASIDLAVDGMPVALLLGTVLLAVGLLTRRAWSAPVTLVGGAVVATWCLATLALATTLPTDQGPVTLGAGTATIGGAGVWAATAVGMVAVTLRRR